MVIPIPSLALPIGDSPNARKASVATWALIAMHLMVFLGATLPMMLGESKVDGKLLAEWRERRPAEPTAEAAAVREAMTAEERRVSDAVERLSSPHTTPEPNVLYVFGGGYRPGSLQFYKLFTSLFLHAGLLAMGFHLLLLWIIGGNVEHHIGRLPFVALYGGGGALGGLLGSQLSLFGSTLPVLSSTSAIGALLGAYYVFFFRYTEINVAYVGRYVGWLAWRPPIAGSLYIKARIVLPALAILVGLMGHMNAGARGATWAGVAIGCVAAVLLHKVFGPDEPSPPNQWYPDPLRVTADSVDLPRHR